MPRNPPDELPTLDLSTLDQVTGGAGFDMMTMMMMMMMMRGQQAPVVAAAPSALPAWQPTITIDGVPQQLTPGANGSYSVNRTI
jgi:hypothetical protein